VKNKQTPNLERFNPKTGLFELISEIDQDEMIEILGVFSAEERIMYRTIQIDDWMYNLKGVPHIEYD
jgi:hypothetical protein